MRARMCLCLRMSVSLCACMHACVRVCVRVFARVRTCECVHLLVCASTHSPGQVGHRDPVQRQLNGLGQLSTTWVLVRTP